MVEDSCLGGSGGGTIVMTGDRVQELGEHRRIDVARALLDHPEPQVDVAEEAPLSGLPERRATTELADAADVVQERGGEEQVGSEPRMELRGLTAEGRHPDRVLEQAPRVAVVPVGTSCRQRTKRGSDLRVRHERADDTGEAGVSDLRGEELEEAVELVRISPKRGCELRRIGILDGLHGANLHLELASEPLDATEHPDGVALCEAPVEELDVVPDASVDATARIGELEREIRGACARAAPLLPRDCEDALDGPILGELRDRRHGASLGPEGIGTLGRMADLQPFRAVRYTGAAGPLAELVAPPYDAVGDEERARLFTRSPHNVIHLTLPESVEDAGRLYHEWLEDGILARDTEPTAWLAAEEYVGPDGIARERHGIVLSVLAETYAARHVLPHERTHPPIRDERLELLRATRVQPEPILLLADTSIELSAPVEAPEIEVEGSRLWRVDLDLGALREAQLLIADGHHRYESAVAFGLERGVPGARIMALVVPAHDVGLHVFPTHRTFAARPDLAAQREGERQPNLEDALEALAAEPFSRSAAVAYRRGSVELVRGDAGELDVELVDRHGLDGIGYTPRAPEAIEAVERGDADVAFILREPRVDDVFELARRGERMPPKSTYFHPKPLSGLLFHPVAE